MPYNFVIYVKRGEIMTKTNGESSYRRFLDGDKNRIERLVVRHSDELVRYAYCYVKNSAVAEDIMEDAFASLLVKWKRFSERDNLRAYLYKITRNKCLDYLRLHKRQAPLNDYENVLVAKDLFHDVMHEERNRTLYKFIQNLPPQYAEVLYLIYINECIVEEVGELLKKSKKQVYNLLSRAKTALKELLKKEGISYEDV